MSHTSPPNSLRLAALLFATLSSAPAAGMEIPLERIRARATEAFALVQSENGTAGLALAVRSPLASTLAIDLPTPIRGAKLRLAFRELHRNLKAVRVFYAAAGEPFTRARSTKIALGSRKTYDIRIGDGVQQLRLDFITAGKRARFVLESAALVPVSIMDRKAAPYVLALLLALALILPGTMMTSLLFRRRSTGRFLALAPLFSVLFYLGLFAVMLAGRAWLNLDRGHGTLAIAIAAATLLFVLLHRRARMDSWWRQLRDGRAALVGYLVIVLVATAIVSHDTHFPFQNLRYQSISGPKTWDVFRAHDNMFQYANGSVLAGDASWEELYGTRARPKLLYMPQDRGMLAGALYASIRKLLEPFSDYVARSYLTYTIVGIAFNVLVVFPLIAFARRYFPTVNPYLFLTAVSLNGFVLTNYYFTWFKFAGAALFLSGLYLMIEDRRRISNWLLAGLLFALATNMHGGNALGLPLLFLWFVVRQLRDEGWWRLRWTVAPLALVLAFATASVPWSMAKQRYFTEDYKLLKTFLLAGQDHPDGLFASARLFFERYTLQEQIAFRASSLYTSLRVAMFQRLGTLLAEGKYREFLRLWSGREFSRLILLFLPLVLFLTFRRFTRSRAPPGARPHAGEVRTLIALGLATSILLIIVAFSRTTADVLHAQPEGVVLLTYALMAGLLLSGARQVRQAYGVYLFTAFLRLRLFL